MVDVKETQRVTSVTFLDPRRERLMIGLLGAIALMLALLLTGLGLAGYWGWQQYQAARTTLSEAMGQQTGNLHGDLEATRRDLKAALRASTEAIRTTQALSRDLIRRQATMNKDLAVVGQHSLAALGQLDRRRATFNQIPPDPFLKADYAIRMSQLALDELVALNRHLVSTEVAVAKDLALTPTQRRMLERGQ